MDRFDRANLHDLEHVPLAVAAGQTYFRVVGAMLDQKRAAHHDEVLNNVAHALTNVASIFYLCKYSGVREVSPFKLLQSHFKGGAAVLILKDGTELRGLSIRRADLRDAVAILRAAKACFGK